MSIKDFTDSIVENIINTSDEDILKEVKEDYGDEKFLANKMRGIIQKAKIEVEKNQYKECPICCGEATWYGLAPHSHNIGANLNFKGSTVMVDRKDFPDNFSEDPEAKGCGMWSCKNCNGNGMVNLDGSIIEIN